MLNPEDKAKLAKPSYIDHSVYAEFDGFHVILTTNNGYPDDPRNKIFMSPTVVIGLIKYLDKLSEAMKKGAE